MFSLNSFPCLKYGYIQELHVCDRSFEDLKAVVERVGEPLRVGNFYIEWAQKDLPTKLFGFLNGTEGEWVALFRNSIRADTIKIYNSTLEAYRMIREPEFFLANYSPDYPKKLHINNYMGSDKQRNPIWYAYRNEQAINFIRTLTSNNFQVTLGYTYEFKRAFGHLADDDVNFYGDFYNVRIFEPKTFS